MPEVVLYSLALSFSFIKVPTSFFPFIFLLIPIPGVLRTYIGFSYVPEKEIVT